MLGLMRKQMAKYLLAFSMAILFFVNCSDEIVSDNEDEKLLEIVYSDYKYPEGFYTENLDSASIYYVNTISIKPLNEREPSSIELSTNDRDTAYFWSELSCLNSSYYRIFISEKETDKYFEFRRVYEDNPKDIVLFRAHKTMFLDRSMYDYFNPGQILGKYNASLFEFGEVKELVEYLIFVKTYNNCSYKVLDSNCIEEPSRFIHTITEIITNYGGWGLRDEINVWEKQYFVDKSSGYITVKKELVKTILGHLN